MLWCVSQYLIWLLDHAKPVGGENLVGLEISSYFINKHCISVDSAAPISPFSDSSFYFFIFWLMVRV